MSEPRRNPHLPFILSTKHPTDPLLIAFRTLPQVNGHVKNCPLNNPDKFTLSHWLNLIVQSTQHIFLAFGMIILHKLNIKPSRFLEGPRIKAFEKKPTLISKNPGFNNKYAWY